jgi:uncharacterized protein (DUF362 family)
MKSDIVGVIKTEPKYPKGGNISPHRHYPELVFNDVNQKQKNHVYSAVRSLFHHLEFDKNNYGKSNWNPLGEIINKGDTVVIKPNMVRESHLSKPADFEYIITHGAVLRAICDYVIIALQGSGSIIFADSPETDADFDLICQRNGLHNILKFYKKNIENITIDLLDLRKEKWIKKDGVIVKRTTLSGDSNGYVKIPLNEKSEFYKHESNCDYYGATFDKEDTKRHHHDQVHEYLISGTILKSDVIINVPKLKTHKKAGLTCCLKNLVGINGDKNWLPHHTEGSPAIGGDQFADDGFKSVAEYKAGARIKSIVNRFPALSRLISKLKPIGRIFFGSTEEIVRSGNWYGNDTVWRMILDLNKILLYFDSEGQNMKNKRKILCVVDAIIAGDNLGPLHAYPKPIGLLVGCFDPVLVDRTCAQLVGFDYKKIPSIIKSFNIKDMPITPDEYKPLSVVSNIMEFNGALEKIKLDSQMRFTPHFGWKGHIELKD